MSSITQIGETRTSFSLLFAIALFVVIVAGSLASAYYFPAPSSDVVFVGP
jgi:hypothetical protein